MIRLRKLLFNNKKGFTLVELIVVVAVLGALAVIVVPKVSNITETAEANAALANERIITNAASIWYVENGGTEVKWEKTKSVDNTTKWNGWKSYIDSWPEGITYVKIEADGDIIVR